MSSFSKYVGNGAQTVYAVNQPMPSYSALEVTIDGEVATAGFTYNRTNATVTFAVAPADGVVIKLSRVTQVEPIHKFATGAAFTARNVDTNFTQESYRVEELQDNVAGVKELEESVLQASEDAEAALAQLLASSTDYIQVGTFAAGYGSLQTVQQTLLHSDGHRYGWSGSFPKTVPAGSTPTPLGSGGWIDRTDVVLRNELGDDSGAGLIGFSHVDSPPESTVGAKLKQIVAITDAPFNAVPGVDSTAAIDAAATAADFIFVPDGVFISSNNALPYWKFFGQGRLIYGTREAELAPYPQSGACGKFYKEETFGNYENAVAGSVVANFGVGQTKENTQIQGTNAQGVAASYQSFDHGGLYVSATNFASVGTTDASTTYTPTSVTAPEITDASVKVGMFLWVPSPTGYVGQVTAVSGNTATVDGWFTWGTGAASTPPNSSLAWINPNTKVWALNANVFLQPTGMAGNATGFELGVVTNKVGSGNNTTGMDVVTLEGEPVGVMYRARGSHTTGYKAELPVYSGFHSENNRTLGGERVGFRGTGNKIGFLSQNEDVGMKVIDALGSSQEIIQAGVVQSLIDSAGAQARVRKAIANYGAENTIGDNVAVAVLIGTPVSLPPSLRGDGRELILTNQTGADVTVNGNGHTISGAPSAVVPSLGKLTLYEFGGNWIK